MIDQNSRDSIVSLAEDCEACLRAELIALDSQDFVTAGVLAEGAERASLMAFRLARHS